MNNKAFILVIDNEVYDITLYKGYKKTTLLDIRCNQHDYFFDYIEFLDEDYPKEFWLVYENRN